MRKVKFAILVGIAALVVGVLPAAAGGNAWGTWTPTGAGASWSGTVSSSHAITGVDVWTRARRFNPPTLFMIGGTKCKLSTPTHVSAYCYDVNFPANTDVHWKLELTKPVRSWAAIVVCIKYNDAFHCRYGNG